MNLRVTETQEEEGEICSSGFAAELSSASGETDSHSWLPSKGVPHDGQGLLPAHHHSNIHIHTSSNRHAHFHLHTPTHMQSSAVSATRRMLSSHTQQGQDFHRKIISREWCHAEPHSAISKQPTFSDYKKKWLNVQHHSSEKFIRMLALHDWHAAYISIQFHHRVLFWHQSAAHRWCTYVRLSVTQRYKRKLVWVSQSAAECFIRHTVVCVHSALSPLFSLAPSLCGQHRELFAFSLLYSHYWSFWWVMLQWLKCNCISAGPTAPFHCKYKPCMHTRLPGTIC